MKAFAWGRVIETFVYDFDGKTVEVVKYFPNKHDNGFFVKGEFEDETAYHIDELHESASSLDYILIAWIARQRLGLNQHALVGGIARALEIT